MRGIWLGLGLMALVSGGAGAESPPVVVVVVELFTSQGCSSCPPADAFLTELAHQRGDVLALAFHVTYWNSLGWKDPYSLDAATDRQRAYGRLLPSDVYTPQMVVDGVRGFVGSNRAAGFGEIAQAEPKRVAVRLTRAGDGLVVSIGAGAGQARVLLVGYDAEHQTPIGRGENGGRTLRESNIVRSLSQIAVWNGQSVGCGRRCRRATGSRCCCRPRVGGSLAPGGWISRCPEALADAAGGRQCRSRVQEGEYENGLVVGYRRGFSGVGGAGGGAGGANRAPVLHGLLAVQCDRA